MSDTVPTPSDPLMFCSFCGKNRDQVRWLISGGNVYLCNDCLDACNEIAAERNREDLIAEWRKQIVTALEGANLPPLLFDNLRKLIEVTSLAK